MNKLSSTLILLCICSGLYAQSTLNATGGGATIGANSYDYSIGEMTLVSTSSTAAIIVTQGILQPHPVWPSDVNNTTISKDQLRIYPNPSSAVFYLQPSFQTAGTLKAALLDPNGRVVKYYDWWLAIGSEKQEIDISSLAQGNYFLHINYKDQDNTYKIQKIK